MRHKYSTKSDGVPGNDDFGTMSAWYLFAAAGLYPQAGSSRYILGSPIFAKLTIKPLSGNGGKVVVLAHNNSASNVYVQRVEVNGNKLATLFIDHSDLFGPGRGVTGSLVEFWMGAELPTP